MNFFHFSTKEAIAISSFTILISAFARFLYSLNEKNPVKPHVVLIDYGLASVMMPATLAGAQIGILAFFYISELTIIGLLVALLTVLMI
jgi:uncharacterized membrane protein YfcA